MSALSALPPPPPLTTIRNETFFRVDVGWRCWQAARGWLCLTDAQRYYTTLQFWQVTGTADGVYPGYLSRFSPYLVSYAGCGRDARDPRGICNNLGFTPAGVYPGYLSRFSPYLASYAGRGRDARDFEGFLAERLSLPTPIQKTFKPRGICNNLGCTRKFLLTDREFSLL